MHPPTRLTRSRTLALARLPRVWLLLLWPSLPAVAPSAVHGQATAAAAAPAWDSPRALGLVETARVRRLLPAQDTTLRNYTAKAEGFVYFYLDRRETDERTLVKVDQVALELFWAPPNRTKQNIVGMRDMSRLPNRMHYHLDHLTVVQDGFGDVIRMGDGDEVADVPHPAAPGSDSIYQFRLTDSLTLQLPGAAQPIRVYEIQVRPRRVDRSALVGSMFVDRADGAIVRMTFTFTPASYVDRRLDYISVSLDNGLWEGRYWLPHEQTLQIRRQIPELDFAAGAVIHGRMRIGDYVFNDSVPERTFFGHPVSAVPRAQRESYDFDSDILDDLNAAGLAPPPDLAEVRRQAAVMLGRARLSGLPSLRPSIGSASSAFRYNRAEGVAAGAGLTWSPGPPWRADIHAGHAFGPGRPWGDASVRHALAGGGGVTLRTVLRETRDVGLAPAVPPAINTLAGLFLADDWTDPYYATGARLTIRHALVPRVHGSFAVGLERHRSAGLTQRDAPLGGSSRFRPVRPIEDGAVASIAVAVERTAADLRLSAWSGSLSVEAGVHDGGSYVRPVLETAVRRATSDHARTLELRGSAGWVSAAAPLQRLFALGGHGTLPGYDYRAFAGSRYGLLQAEGTWAVLAPWLTFRGVAAAGAVAGSVPGSRPQADPVPEPSAGAVWATRPTGRVRASTGAGVSLLWDLLRIDAVRGLDGGRWRLHVSFHRDFRDIS
jgi:hypothetical protein